jgi:glutathione synthase/RimK-type ligase-like ATP-grasp enzyme
LARRILILTEANDIHAIAVAEALERKGAEVTLWATSDFPTQADESVRFDSEGAKTIRIQGTGIGLMPPDFETVWRRRPTFVLDTIALHPADVAFAESECGMFRRSLFHLISPGAFWVNPLVGAALAGSKLLQQEAAARVGLKMPETLFTNSPSEIRRFLGHCGEVVYKPLSGTGWQTKEAQYLPYTALVTAESLVADELLRQTPGIFQELVPKAYELRVTVMGRHFLAAKVFSQATEKGRIDWRRAQDELRFEPIFLPPKLADQCFSLLSELGLVFGCFDFVVTPQGEHVFLEVNEMGQFLFVERCCGLPLLDAFSEFLLQGLAEFDWSADAVQLRYTDPEFEAAALARLKVFQSSHRSRGVALVDEE